MRIVITSVADVLRENIARCVNQHVLGVNKESNVSIKSTCLFSSVTKRNAIIRNNRMNATVRTTVDTIFNIFIIVFTYMRLRVRQFRRKWGLVYAPTTSNHSDN